MSTTPRVIIIGAGFGGLAAAIELKRHGIESFEVLERADHVGGVWQANSYPGAACDVPSVIYQFSYALKPDWSRRFGTQPEIRRYLDEVTDEFGVRAHIRFGTEVTAAAWSQEHGVWTVTGADGTQRECDVLLCATGQLSRPKVPQLPGRFEGPQFHSAQWDHGVDLTGKRVVVVGGGASTVQIVPAIAERTRRLTVIQRSPSWVVGKHDWTPSGVEKALMRRFSWLQRAHHNAMWWWFESRAPSVRNWARPLRHAWAAERRRTIRRIVGEPKAAALTPDYELGCNRLLLSSDWYPTLAREDVDVVRAGVSELFGRGVVCDDGTRVAADVVVWCTGFTATEYLAPIEITGRGGRTIREAWADGPEAYLGLATHGFPNLFMSYGPNTGSLTNTIVYLVERQAAYMRQAVEHIGRSGGWVDVRRDVHDGFNRDLQARLQDTVFTSGCPGWYATDAGKVTQVWVGSHVEYGHRTRRFDVARYETGVPSASQRLTRPAPSGYSPAATLKRPSAP